MGFKGVGFRGLRVYSKFYAFGVQGLGVQGCFTALTAGLLEGFLERCCKALLVVNGLGLSFQVRVALLKES